MATERSGYTLQVIKAGQQGHVEMRWGHLADVDTRAAAAAIVQQIGRPSSAAGQQEISLSLTMPPAASRSSFITRPQGKAPPRLSSRAS